MRLFVVFPNHLFEQSIPLLKQYNKIYVIEEPMYFYDDKYRPFKYNKVRLAYLRACMKSYYDFLKSKHLDIEYIEFNNISNYKFLKGHDLYCFDTFDKELDAKFDKLSLKFNIIKDTPYFIATQEWRQEFIEKKQNKNISNAEYFKFLKTKLNLFVDVKSYDTENRNSLPPNVKIPQELKYTNSYYTEAIKYVDNHPLFKNNIGNTANVTLYPISSKDAKHTLKQFLTTKLNKFGDYQDAIAKDHSFLFHANISSSLNIGLLTPSDVIQQAIAYYQNNKSTISINNIEAFIRQVLGWREFIWLIYDTFHKDILASNYWENTRSLRWEYWYGKRGIGIESLDNEIQKCVELAYAHHIVRLMIFLNIMVLCEIRPQDIKQWFMEVCAIDAYEWVMVGNIWAMGHFTNKYMKKPYLSTENYLIKMSDYKSTETSHVWTSLFYDFLWTKSDKLVGSASIYTRNLAYFKKLDAVSKNKIIAESKVLKNKVSYKK